jgi:phosphopantetheinyl transferase
LAKVGAAPVSEMGAPAFLSEDISGRIRARRRDEDRQRSLTSYALALSGTMRLYGRPAGTLRIHASSSGKPCFAPSVGVLFNCSHSGDWSVCVLAARSDLVDAVGIDVEMIAERPDYGPTGFFHPGEKAWLAGIDEKHRPEAFYRLWTLKESYIKAVGLGLGIPLDSFEIRFDQFGKPCVSRGKPERERPTVLTFPDSVRGYSASVCVLGPEDHRDQLEVQWHFPL